RSTSVEKDYMIREVSLEELVRTAIKKQAKQIIEYKVDIKLGKLEEKVFVDSKWIDFMLGQIITNSLKYRKEHLILGFEAEITDTQVILKIIDNGIGIPTKDVGRVFDKGFTGENGRKYAKSTGIGLYLCQKLCEKMHLGMGVVSEEGKGTQVSFVFPKDKRVFFEA
ncbi:MAG: ATP-binding protein, partial [Cellulosilyticaceae bacterium]